jgi:hypothetical protein
MKKMTAMMTTPMAAAPIKIQLGTLKPMLPPDAPIYILILWGARLLTWLDQPRPSRHENRT